MSVKRLFFLLLIKKVVIAFFLNNNSLSVEIYRMMIRVFLVHIYEEGI